MFSKNLLPLTPQVNWSAHLGGGLMGLLLGTLFISWKIPGFHKYILLSLNLLLILSTSIAAFLIKHPPVKEYIHC
jgi:predicted lipid-binding transport protein (Tim44 family)